MFGSGGALIAANDLGNVDWNGGYVTAVGYGTAPQGMSPAKAMLNARRAAEIDAQRALLETVKGVHIDTQTTVDSSMQRDVTSRTRIEGVIRGAVITKQDLTVVSGVQTATVTMRICLDGKSADCSGKPAVVSAINLERLGSPDADGSTMAMKSLTPTVSTPRQQATFDNARPVTGSILLLGGLSFERVLLPVVVSRNKGENFLVYGVRRVAPEVVRTSGIVRYAASLEQARVMDVAGTNPVVIAVEAVSTDNRIVIASQDAAILEETLRNGNNFLEKGRVVIVQ
jgi:hypothetical protein